MEETVDLWELSEVIDREYVYEHSIGILEDGDFVGYQTIWIFENLLRNEAGENVKRYSVDLQSIPSHAKWSLGEKSVLEMMIENPRCETYTLDAKAMFDKKEEAYSYVKLNYPKVDLEALIKQHFLNKDNLY